MRENYEFYKALLEQDLRPEFNSLWDLVVITAISSAQKSCFERQIENKLLNRRLPQLFEFMVINDPDKCKIGSGGSTLNVVKRLSDKYGREKLNQMKILLIHAGGYSQRMPSCTVLGKIFCPLASKYFDDMLEMKLALYTPFSIRMKPGVFLTSSDDIETFYFDEQVESGIYFGLDDTHFTFLAHKSSLDIGKDHGVYVVGQSIANGFGSEIFECKTVLQKPTVQRMRDYSAVLGKEENEFVYTDSIFYFNNKVVFFLLDFYEKYYERICEKNIEIDAYRDFLQPLGCKAISLGDYLNNIKVPESQHDLFESLYKMLNDCKSIILALKDSDFYHLGTLNEMLDVYSSDSLYAKKFRESISFTHCKPNQFVGQHALGCILNSKVNQLLKSESDSYIEYSFVDEDITLSLGKLSLLSNCMLNKKEIANRERLELQVPANVCLHTIPIKCASQTEKTTFITKYVTVFFNRNDDLKKKYKSAQAVVFMGRQIHEAIASTIGKTFENENSIWSLKLFAAHETMSESFLKALDLIDYFLSDLPRQVVNSTELYSLFDLLYLNDYERMISFRTEFKLGH
jgi:fucose-1-phosphate guanylyltransferase